MYVYKYITNTHTPPAPKATEICEWQNISGNGENMNMYNIGRL